MKKRILPIASGILLTYTGCLYLAGRTLLSREALQKLLMTAEPRILDLHAVLLAVLLALVIVRRRGDLRANARTVAAACLASAIGILAALTIVPDTHRLYFDEDIYVQVGQSIAGDGVAGMLDVGLPAANENGWRGVAYTLNKEPSGYSHLVSLAVRFFGLSHDAGRATTLFFFALGAAGVVAWGASLYRSAGIALAAGILYALWPENLRWSLTAATELTAASLAIWSLWLGRLAAGSGRRAEMLLAVTALALAVQIRPEGLLLVAPFLAFAGSYGGGCFRGWSAKLPVAALFGILVLAHALHLSAVSHESWGAMGPKFSLDYVEKNLLDNLSYWFIPSPRGTTLPAPAGVAVLAVLGLFAHRWSRSDLAGIGLWILAFFGIFIPFYAGSYYYGVDLRFSLLMLAPLLLLAASAVGGLVRFAANFVAESRAWGLACGSAAVFALALSFIPRLVELPVLGEEAWQARADHAAVELFSSTVEPDAIVIAHSPGMWATRGRATAQVAWLAAYPDALERLVRAYPVYYHFDYWDLAPAREQEKHWRKEDTPQALGIRVFGKYPSIEVRRAESKGDWVMKLYRLVPPDSGARQGV